MRWSDCLCCLINKMKIKVSFLSTFKKRHTLTLCGLVKRNPPKQDAKKIRNEKKAEVFQKKW